MTAVYIALNQEKGWLHITKICDYMCGQYKQHATVQILNIIP